MPTSDVLCMECGYQRRATGGIEEMKRQKSVCPKCGARHWQSIVHFDASAGGEGSVMVGSNQVTTDNTLRLSGDDDVDTASTLDPSTADVESTP